MAFPHVAAVNGGNNESETATEHTVNLPSGIVSGNLLLVFFTGYACGTITFPSGWTQLFSGAETYMKLEGWYRIADGTEGSTITVTTLKAWTNNTSYRITAYSGTPEAGTASTGIDANPNPPNLAPSWGAFNTLWFAAIGTTAHASCSAYPTNYTDGRFDAYDIGGSGVGLGSARRELNAISDDPGTFTVNAISRWVANTVVVDYAPAKPYQIQNSVRNNVVARSLAAARNLPEDC